MLEFVSKNLNREEQALISSKACLEINLITSIYFMRKCFILHLDT